MKAVEGSIAWAQGDPPSIRGPWESTIIELAEKGDPRFVRILRKHIENRVIRSARALAVFENPADEATRCGAESAGAQ